MLIFAENFSNKMNTNIKLIICWLWTNKIQILEDVQSYAETLDAINLCCVFFYETLRFYYDQNQNKTHKKSLRS